MNFIKKSTVSTISTLVLALSFTTIVSAQIYGNINVSATAPTAAVSASTTLGFRNLSTTTRMQMRAQASSTRSANIAARQAAMMQKAMADADSEITARINSLNALISKVSSIKNVSAADKASITLTTQNEIASMTTLKAQIDSDTSTTSMRADLQSITVDYRVYALIEPQLEILTAADRINQIISLMTIVQTKLQTRISALQSAGIDTTSLTATLADITTEISDAQTQSTNAVSTTAGLVPDQGNTAIAASNEAALKAARVDIKTGNSDLQAADKNLSSIVASIKSLMPKGSVSATTTVSATTSIQ